MVMYLVRGMVGVFGWREGEEGSRLVAQSAIIRVVNDLVCLVFI